jgi:hypothetical protein
MELNDYGNCCGARIAEGWYGPVKDVAKFIKVYVGYMESGCQDGFAFLSAVLTEDQVKRYSTVLKNNGFVNKGTGINPSTGNKLTFFLRTRKSKAT